MGGWRAINKGLGWSGRVVFLVVGKGRKSDSEVLPRRSSL